MMEMNFFGTSQKFHCWHTKYKHLWHPVNSYCCHNTALLISYLWSLTFQSCALLPNSTWSRRSLLEIISAHSCWCSNCISAWTYWSFKVMKRWETLKIQNEQKSIFSLTAIICMHKMICQFTGAKYMKGKCAYNIASGITAIIGNLNKKYRWNTVKLHGFSLVASISNDFMASGQITSSSLS